MNNHLSAFTEDDALSLDEVNTNSTESKYLNVVRDVLTELREINDKITNQRQSLNILITFILVTSIINICLLSIQYNLPDSTSKQL